MFEDAVPGTLPAGWATRWAGARAAADAPRQAQRNDWLLQSAAEIAYREPLITSLAQPPTAAATPPAMQALFCIDVRSEVLRRALQSVSPAVHTRGLAGFFGLFIAYSPLGSALERPQLPGLLAPAHCVSEGVDGAALGQVLATHRRSALQWRQRWAQFRGAPASAFSFAGSMGLLYGPKLLADSLPSSAAPARWEDAGLPPQAAATLRACLPQAANDPAAAAANAKASSVPWVS